jgi:hypothetical protein
MEWKAGRFRDSSVVFLLQAQLTGIGAENLVWQAPISPSAELVQKSTMPRFSVRFSSAAVSHRRGYLLVKSLNPTSVSEQTK